MVPTKVPKKDREAPRATAPSEHKIHVGLQTSSTSLTRNLYQSFYVCLKALITILLNAVL